jgi:hypothetical protein
MSTAAAAAAAGGNVAKETRNLNNKQASDSNSK